MRLKLAHGAFESVTGQKAPEDTNATADEQETGSHQEQRSINDLISNISNKSQRLGCNGTKISKQSCHSVRISRQKTTFLKSAEKESVTRQETPKDTDTATNKQETGSHEQKRSINNRGCDIPHISQDRSANRSQLSKQSFHRKILLPSKMSIKTGNFTQNPEGKNSSK